MTETCDLCHSSALESIYEPAHSKRALAVCLCSNCGLVQSLPRADRTSRSADRKSIRHRETIRTEASLSLIRAEADLQANLHVLDVGSHAGSFARAMLAAAPGALMTCVESEGDIPFPDAGFDIVHSFGAIEQRVSPASALAEYWRLLKPGGLLIIDASNIAAIDSPDIVEEWFADKHLYHFSQATLARLLKLEGFEIVSGANPADRENLLFAARKRERTARSNPRDPREVDAALALITAYVTNRARIQRAA